MAISDSGPPIRRARRLALGALLLAVALVLAGLAGRWAGDAATDKLRLAGAQRLDGYAVSLENLLSKYDFLPGTLELHKDVIALLERPHDEELRDEVNAYLEQLNRQSGSTTIYIVNLDGVTQAASNWRSIYSFVGDHVAFRPYVRDALRGMPGGFYGVGTTNGEPGYFFAHGIYHNGRMLGVATVKVNIERLERGWEQGAGKVLLTDSNGVVFLSSVPAWKYRTLAPLSPEVAKELQASRQYSGHALAPLGMRELRRLDGDAAIVTLPEDQRTPVLSQTHSLAPRHWKFVYLSDLNSVRASARNVFLFALLVQALLLLLVLYLRQRTQTRAQLEAMVAERTVSLREMTQHLSEENSVRRVAEEKLRRAQSELVQAGKMAVLGQMAAGITHELNQPLTALRTMSDNARVLIERGRLEEASGNLATISQLVARMGTLTGQLRQFARKADASLAAVPLEAAIHAALFLVERRIEQERVTFRLQARDANVQALCDTNRLEQVLVNLFTNALDAMEGSAVRELVASVRSAHGRALIIVEDTGPGLPEDVRAHLFEPFFTTKPQGKGLGLGLAISEQIIREFGGELRAEAADTGARFIIELPLAQQGTT
ncbi:two-component system, NtrC family, C4-dicarboxylate transport sensor histidine kinase DctB [Duganella sp. CF402]|uniref:sensor histidine kinase n=1 Tax=unclassified Duganella TaxID=2636909 RepID=UPI0008BEE155|nr:MULTISPECIES: ATP-binding protein [unclassified Duganella]RZT11022.1 two-component system C4-dicarboxylate transport sensor histidine kinase DctB [Duganella sp. BK701]SEK85245.1 two-component system, NtrC family, C4-dicarboxylate transport sensor histidine kinase DctB [Duganella sp. CF402]